MIKSPTEKLIAEKDGAIGWLTFNNPARRNALSIDMWEGIPTVIHQFEQDDDIRVIVLRGTVEAKAFISGADISEFEKRRASNKDATGYNETSANAFGSVEHCQKPTIAMIQGYCLGGGLAFANMCDMRLASENSRFSIPAAKLGLGYGWTGVKKLIDLVGPAFAKEIFLTARQFNAAEALAMGLINRVLPDGEIEAYTRSYCGMIAENAPLTMKAIRAAADELGRPDGQVDASRLDALVAACFDSADYKEGRNAFLEKRKPQFKGR
ncbi:MAG TPA: enoyl-CoA hydratase [Stellaceae bacterium]|jgi:enoyl-CoA hydratase/carnithine racemase